MDIESTPQNVKLTRRELDVLRLVAKGYSTKEIAAELGIGLDTVRGYRKQLHSKLQVTKATELIYRATELQLL
ncbi:MAG: response regulator transcription factor [Bacteroidales bacterium]|nr:response regulator transcription factor [Bacteroidales bacterium]